MLPRIALPLPTSFNVSYNQLNWPSYADALRQAGAEPVAVALDLTPRAIAELANGCCAVLLPGSPADVNPAKYGQARDAASAPADLARENVDELLLQDAHNLYKPILGICYGAQTLNVWRSGTLIQDVTCLPVNHRAARGVGVAHSAAIAPESVLAGIVVAAECEQQDGQRRLPVNSSHHQAIGIPGDGLRVCARCPQDGVVEAVEGGQRPENEGAGAGQSHFVLGVQWHPERTLDGSASSRALFARLVLEASGWVPRTNQRSIAS